MKTLRLILGDQLNINHSWFRAPDPDVIYTLMELRQETDYAQHHQQKVIAFLLAMRYFADALRAAGHRVDYRTLDDPRNTQSLTQNLTRLLSEYRIDRFEYLLPDEYRLDRQLVEFCASIPFPTGVQDTEFLYYPR